MYGPKTPKPQNPKTPCDCFISHKGFNSIHCISSDLIGVGSFHIVQKAYFDGGVYLFTTAALEGSCAIHRLKEAGHLAQGLLKHRILL